MEPYRDVERGNPLDVEHEPECPCHPDNDSADGICVCDEIRADRAYDAACEKAGV